jgi:hypothetical protein
MALVHRIERRCINELHRGNALLGWQAGKAIHDEGRKSKKTPAMSPQLSAEINVKAKSRPLIIWGSVKLVEPGINPAMPIDDRRRIFGKGLACDRAIAPLPE